MWKPILAGTAVIAIAGSSLVYAQSGAGRPDGVGRGPSMEDMRAFGEARLAALKAGLQLTPEQERHWPAFEAAARELAKLRMERRAAAWASVRGRDRDSEPRTTDPIERMRTRGAAMAAMGAALQKLAEATDPLYKSLDDAQKRRFAMLARMGMGAGDRGPGFRRPGGYEFRGRPGGGDEPRGPGRERRRSELGPDSAPGFAGVPYNRPYPSEPYLGGPRVNTPQGDEERL
jgi:zinc resistance-associated protein